MNDVDRNNSENWYTRPVFFVSDIERAIQHYQGLLGFRPGWDYREDGRTIIAQTNRGSGCEIILCEDSVRAGMSRVFISLETQELATLREEIRTKGISAKQSWWGYPVIEINDPDGNEMLFSFEDEK